jgi:Right handed beta helix region
MTRNPGLWATGLIAAALAAQGAMLSIGTISHAAGMEFAQDTPQLPEAGSLIGPLRRGLDGNVEVFDPTAEQGKGVRLCHNGTICVGKDQAFPSLADALTAARDGDTIEIVGGTYHETGTIRGRNVTVRGIAGRPHIDCSGLRIAGDKACLLLATQGITLENLEISGAELPDSLGANGACIRNDKSESFTIREVICHGSQDGILSGGGDIVIENSEFYDNGWTDRTHNVYFSGNCSVTVRGSIFRDARIGHEFKSRCRTTEITDSTFRSTKGSRDLDIPDGGETTVYRSTLVKTEGAASDEIVGFAAESCDSPADMLLKDVRIINSRNRAVIHNFGKCEGRAIILQDVTFEGIPPVEEGDILKK